MSDLNQAPDPVPVDEAPEPEVVFSQELQDLLEKSASEKAAAEAAVTARKRAEDEAIAELDAVKAVCVKACGEIADAIAKIDPSDLRTITALQELERSRHAEHKDILEAAYLKFSGQREGDSHPATPGLTNLDTHATMSQQVEGIALPA